jgi:diadenosine tetraphosphate (Ap4A) HIT family hydrolase
MKSCFFCHIDKSEYIAESKYSFARFDGFPVSEGHVLIISKAHAQTYFDLSEVEQHDIMKLVTETKKILDKKFATSNYNVGINCGLLAGQSIDHVHIHLIPRREGDKEDPRGGVRWVLPEKANYWDE